MLDLARLARVLLQNLARRSGQPFNAELYQQILGSGEVMRRILCYSQVPAGFMALPVHPWQARYLMRQAFVLEAIRSGRIQPLGQGGSIFYPTASVRTLYQPGNPFFYKFSTHVRLTNCVRKNAYYELESAVVLSQVLREHLEPMLADYPGFMLMYEPAYGPIFAGNWPGCWHTKPLLSGVSGLSAVVFSRRPAAIM